MYVGYKDGTTYYQDKFGRTSGAHDYLRREKIPNPGPNDRCGCGSGHKFKRCCGPLPEADRPTWEVFGIRERNLMFAHRVKKILGLNNGKSWNDVRRELNDEQVKAIHQSLTGLWPQDTDLVSLLPRPNLATSRAVYLGALDARIVDLNVISLLAYFDELVVANPFLNPIRIKPEFSPVASPAKHRSQTLRNVLLLLLLEPFIELGIVHLVPDLGDFNGAFAQSVMSMAEARTKGYRADKASRKQFAKLAADDHKRFLSRLPEEDIARYLRKGGTVETEEDVQTIVAQLKAELADDPYTLLQPVEPGEDHAQLQFVKGFALESGMFLAMLTGSILYTDVHAHWQLLHSGTSALSSEKWQALTDAWRDLPLVLETHGTTSLKTRLSGQHGEIRAAIRRAIQRVSQNAGDGVQVGMVDELSKAKQVLRSEWTKPSARMRLRGQITASIPEAGFDRTEVRRLLLTFAASGSAKPIPIAFLLHYWLETDGDSD